MVLVISLFILYIIAVIYYTRYKMIQKEKYTKTIGGRFPRPEKEVENDNR